jgi:hypothetical protein
MKNLLSEAWTLAGVLLVIITLSGDVRTQAILISVVALGFWALGTYLDRDEEGGDESGKPSE